MVAKRLDILYCGSLIVDKGGVLTYHVDNGKIVEMPVLTYLIRTEYGNILFDSGLNHDDFPSLLSLGKNLKVKEEDCLLNRLRDVGVAPDDINLVVQSHLHWDHSGMLGYFPNAEIIIQREEYGYAMNPPTVAEAYYRRHYYDRPDLNWRIIDGDETLMPGITAILTPGHTPGHQSLLADLQESGTIILSGDCASTHENIERELIPGLFVNQIEALHSLKKLKSLAIMKNAHIFFTHEWPGKVDILSIE